MEYRLLTIVRYNYRDYNKVIIVSRPVKEYYMLLAYDLPTSIPSLKLSVIFQNVKFIKRQEEIGGSKTWWLVVQSVEFGRMHD